MKRLLLFLFSIFTLLSLQAQQSVYSDTCRSIEGIDLSHYQGTVFWESVGNSRVAYVYLKATEGGSRIDSKYQENIDLAHRQGLKVGSYHFYRPRYSQQQQLDNFLSQCRPGDQDLIPMVDIETRSGLSEEEFCDSLFKFLRLIERTYRQKPLIYTGANFYNQNLAGKVDNYKLMIAQYTSRLPRLADGRDFELWQYTGKGRLDGINGYVDMSRFMGRHRLREIRFRHR
ncbi:MAG: glycosyl hydrolase family 25 [Prevotella sp.]|jgi:lysozyme|uniref:Glycosyl hydrolase family 25 n=1 Tax=Segatella cerevisiae TaxID=2053716 RepID=A0ABT1BVB7_9BACT|nr:GH25 family lysozyme [Segatella cerevisiae]MCH3995959.1 glycosyl hydrolase family 25 [Prevotella sp.]MCI1247001.1 glycosyl hydrolase family 25 [Prevotella sp.]MCO6025036.1 glycosyl hydrolase family 25 [Segatella cerevisiae]